MSTLRNIKTLQYDAELLSNNAASYINRSLANLGQRQGEQGDGIEVRLILLSEIIQQLIENDNTFLFIDYTHSIVNNTYDFMNVEYNEQYDASTGVQRNEISFTPLRAEYIENGDYNLTQISDTFILQHTFHDKITSIDNDNIKDIELDYTTFADKIVIKFNYAYNLDNDFTNNTNVKITVSEKIAGFLYEDGVDEIETDEIHKIIYNDELKSYYLVVENLTAINQYEVFWNSDALVDGFALDLNVMYNDNIHDILIRINYCYDVIKDIIAAQNKLMAKNQLIDLLIGILKALSDIKFADTPYEESIINNITLSHNYPFYLIYNVNTELDLLLMCNAAPIKVHILGSEQNLNVKDYVKDTETNIIFCNGKYVPVGLTRTLTIDCFYDERVVNYITLKTSQFKVTGYDPYIGSEDFNWYVNNINTNIRAAGKDAANPNIVFVKTDISGALESLMFDEYSSINAEIIACAAAIKLDESQFLQGSTVSIQNGYTSLDPFDEYVFLLPKISSKLESNNILQLMNILIANTSNIIKVKSEELSAEQNATVYEYKRSTVKQTTFWTYDVTIDKFVCAEYNAGNGTKLPVTLSHIEGVNEYTNYIFNTSPKTAQFLSKVKEMTEFETLRFSTKQIGLKNNESIIVYPSVRSGYTNDFLDDDVNKLQLKYVTGNHIIDKTVNNLVIPLDRVKSENSMNYYLDYDMFKNIYIDIKGNRILPNKDVYSNTYQYDKIQIPIMDISEILINKQTVLNRINLQILDSNGSEMAVPYYVYMGRRPYENNNDTKTYTGYKFTKNEGDLSDLYYPAFYIGSHFLNTDLGEESLAFMNFKSHQNVYSTLISDFIDNKFVKITPKYIVCINDNVILNETEYFNKNQDKLAAIFNNLIVAEKFRIDRDKNVIVFDESLSITNDYHADTSSSKAYIKSLYTNFEVALIIKMDKGFANEFDAKQLYATNQTLRDTFTLLGKILMKVDDKHQYNIMYNGNALLSNVTVDTLTGTNVFGNNIVANDFKVINDNVEGVIAGYNDKNGYNLFEAPYTVQGWYFARANEAIILNKKVLPWGTLGTSGNDAFINHQGKQCVNLNYYITEQLKRLMPTTIGVSKDIVIKDNSIYLLPLTDVQPVANTNNLYTASTISLTLVIEGKKMFIYAWRIGTDYYDIDSINAAISNLGKRVDDINKIVTLKFSYLIIYDPRGGTSCLADGIRELYMDAAYEFRLPNTTYNGNVFQGWYFESENGLLLGLPGDKIMVVVSNTTDFSGRPPYKINRSVTLVAKWLKLKKALLVYHYILQSTHAEVTNRTIEVDRGECSLSTAALIYNNKQYTIVNNAWYYRSDMQSKVTNNVVTFGLSDDRIDVYAYVNENNVSIYFKYASNDSIAAETMVVGVGSKVSLPTSVNDRGYTLNGWLTSKTSVNKIWEYTPTSNTTLYADVTKASFVLYVSAGKSNPGLSSINTFMGSTVKSSYSMANSLIGVALDLPSLTSSGATWNGWTFKDPAGNVTGGRINNGKLTLLASDNGSTLVGNWKGVKYTYIVFDCGSISIDGTTVNFAYEWTGGGGGGQANTTDNRGGTGLTIASQRWNYIVRKYVIYGDGTYMADGFSWASSTALQSVKTLGAAPDYPGQSSNNTAIKTYGRYTNMQTLSGTIAEKNVEFSGWYDGNSVYNPNGAIPTSPVYDSEQSTNSIIANSSIKHVVGKWAVKTNPVILPDTGKEKQWRLQLVNIQDGWKRIGLTPTHIELQFEAQNGFKTVTPTCAKITKGTTGKMVVCTFKLALPLASCRLGAVRLCYSSTDYDGFGGGTLAVCKGTYGITSDSWYTASKTNTQGTTFDEKDTCTYCIECVAPTQTTTTSTTTTLTAVKLMFSGATGAGRASTYVPMTGGKLSCKITISADGKSHTMTYSNTPLGSSNTNGGDLSFAHSKKATITISDIQLTGATASKSGTYVACFAGFAQGSFNTGMNLQTEADYKKTSWSFTNSDGLYNGLLITINVWGMCLPSSSGSGSSGSGSSGSGSTTTPTYSATFKSNGGTFSDGSTSKTITNKGSGVPTPTRTNYVLAGWSTSSSGPATLSTTATLNSFDTGKTFYAIWTPVNVVSNDPLGKDKALKCLSYSLSSTNVSLRNTSTTHKITVKVVYTFVKSPAPGVTTTTTTYTIMPNSSLDSGSITNIKGMLNSGTFTKTATLEYVSDLKV